MSNSTTIWVLIGLLSLGLVVAFYWLSLLHLRFKNAFASLKSKSNLVDTIAEYFDKVGATTAKLDNLQKSYNYLSMIGARSIQKTSLVRFNPFRDTGGDQSFVLAFLDNHDNGLLMTSIHGREGTRVYVKPIEYGTSKYSLSKEEKAALNAAQASQSNVQSETNHGK